MSRATKNFCFLMFCNEDATDFLVFGPYKSHDEAQTHLAKEVETRSNVVRTEIMPMFRENMPSGVEKLPKLRKVGC